jgi:hypothetical protein
MRKFKFIAWKLAKKKDTRRSKSVTVSLPLINGINYPFSQLRQIANDILQSDEDIYEVDVHDEVMYKAMKRNKISGIDNSFLFSATAY